MKVLQLEMTSAQRRARILQATKRRASSFAIEGEAVTLDEISRRLSLGREGARYRLKREQAKPAPVTWAGLGLHR